MGDEKDSWKVKTLDEILQEKKRRKEQEEKAEIKRLKNVSRGFCRGLSSGRAAAEGLVLPLAGCVSGGFPCLRGRSS